MTQLLELSIANLLEMMLVEVVVFVMLPRIREYVSQDSKQDHQDLH